MSRSITVKIEYREDADFIKAVASTSIDGIAHQYSRMVSTMEREYFRGNVQRYVERQAVRHLIDYLYEKELL